MLESVETTPNPAEIPPLPSHGRILSSAAIIGGATVATKTAAFAKDLLVARQFGAGDEMDAYLVAFVVPSFGVTVLASSLAPAFIPTYIRTWENEGAAAAAKLASSALVGVTALVVALAIVLTAAGPWLLPWVGSGFDGPKLALAQSLLVIVAGVLVASGVSSVFAAVLHAHERFAAAAAVPIAVPLVTLAVLWTLYDRLGIFALAAGTMAGFALECVALGCAAFRVGLLPRPRWQGFHPPMRHAAARYWPVVVGSVLISASVVVDQAMAASLGSGQVSTLNYGSKVVTLLLSIVAASLSTVLFPRFSRMITAGQGASLRSTVRAYLIWIVAASVPCAIAVSLLAQPMIAILFERGEFTSEDTLAAGQVQSWLALQIPFYIVVMVGFRLLAALDGYRVMLRIAALNLAINVAGDLVLMRYFGVTGIAMSTSLVYAVAAVVTLAAIYFRLAEAGGQGEGGSRSKPGEGEHRL